ncbi:MAG TPA: oligosaccharide flippase family protein [Petrimonas sp.]|nr:oligosaccharide flippase family protein [Petrimonas sp.]
MGIIIKQSVRGAFWSYLGIAIGYVNVGIIMPQFFDTAQVGLVQLFASVSLIFAQFGTLGFTSVINRLFPLFRDPARQHNGFLFLALTTGLVGFLLSMAVFFIFKPWVVESNIDRSPLLVDYLWWMLPLVLMRILFLLLDNYNKMLYDAVTGTFWMEFIHRIINLFLIVFFALDWISFKCFFSGYILSISIPVIPIIYVLVRRKEFDLAPQPVFFQRNIQKETFKTMVFGFVNGLAGVVLINIDRIFVNQYLSLSEVGIFSVCTLFASFIRVPYNSIAKIATGVIAESWKKNNKSHIQDIFQKAALNQAIFGVLIFVGIVANLHNIFKILPPEYSIGKWVLVIYAAGILINTIYGLAGCITETSKYYRLNTLFLGMVMISQLLLSIVLIKDLGIIGAAISTVSTFILGTLYQAIFQKIYLGIFGLNYKILIVFAIGFLSFGLSALLPEIDLIPDILLRSGIILIFYMTLILRLNISTDLNQYINSLPKTFCFWKNKK